jgi:N-methylhydantoinase A
VTSHAHRLGIDIGGTFTDFTLLHGSTGAAHLWKEDSTPDDPLAAVEAGLRALAEQLGQTPGELLAATRLFVHGTTIATNLLIQRGGPVTALLCTEGFRDILHFRDGFKPERFDIHLPHPEPLVPRWLRIGVPERIGAGGTVLRVLAEDAVREACGRMRRAGVEAVAVAFLWSVVEPRHERRAAEIVAEELPDAHVVCSSDVLGELREWERTSAAVLSAYIRPSIGSYLRRLERSLQDQGLPTPPLVMQVNGGCGRVGDILRRPVSVLSSGPTASPAAALHAARSIDARDLITMDIGGTSCDVCIIPDGQPTVSRDLRVDEQPLGVPGVEIHSIGAGGGSIAWVDSGGALRVGPASAGAAPGPAAYDHGGERPTVTDANLVLGALSADAFLGGRRRLRRDLAAAAIERHVAEPLALDLLTAAAGIRRVVEASMVGAIRALSTERGIDPRRFVLVAGGGAGGLHAVEVARALGIERVLVPSAAGTLCAFGMTVTDVRHDHATALYQRSDSIDLDLVESLFADLEAHARERMREDGFGPGEMVLDRFVDARYVGQVHELTVPIPPGPVTPAFAAAAAESFHHEHERLYTYARRDIPAELLHWRVRATGRTAAVAHEAPVGAANAAPVGSREVIFPGMGPVMVPTHFAPDLTPGITIEGPAVIDGPTTTVLVGPGDRLTVTRGGEQRIDVAPARARAQGGGRASPAGSRGSDVADAAAAAPTTASAPNA